MKNEPVPVNENRRIRRILVPLDGSRLAESALSAAVTMARCLDASISLLHIIEERAPVMVHGEPHLTSTEEAERYLTALADRLAADVTVEQHVHGTEEHDVAGSISAHASELEADMVALCTHGRSGLRRAISGSIAQQVLRRVKAPVLLVRPDMQPLTGLETIMVPLDKAHPAEEALSLAAEIAKVCGAKLHLVSVVPTVGTLTGDAQAAARLTPIATAATLNTQEAQSGIYLQSLLETHALDGVVSKVEVRRGDTPQNLLDAASGTGASLVVLATHARAGLGAFWIGSVASSIIGKVARPLLLVRIASTQDPRR